ncbi:MAG: hypothetical protein JXQ81_02595 [Desulfuromonadales bacterium]|nr:hypothetical protein [Desulfuromonadales bacterium]MBN2791376.1 hypothetical protein [Desulfuromonadales bacterium]
MFSATMMMDFDDGDGRFSAAEVALIKAEATEPWLLLESLY